MQTASFVARFVMLAILSPLVKEIRPDSDIPLGPLLYSEKGRALRGDNALVQIVNELDNGLPPSDESEYETEEYGLGPKPPRPHQAQLHVDKNPKYSAFAKAVLFAKAFFQRLDLVADAFWNDLEILHRKDQEALENFARVYAILQKIQKIRLNAKDQLLFRAFARVLSGVLAMEKTLDAHMPRETDLQEMERILIELDETGFFEGIGSLIWRLRQVQFYTQKTSVFLKTLLNTNLESPESRRQFRALQDTIIHIMGIVGELMLELAAPARHGVFIGDDVLDAGDNAADQLENLGTVAQIGKTTLTEAVGGVFSERLLTQVPQLAIAMHNLIRRLRRKPEFMKGIIYVNISALNVHLRTMRWVEQNGGWVELDLPRKNGSSSFFTVDSVSIATENAFGLDPPMARLVSEELFSVLKDWDPAAPEECRWTKWANWSGCSITCGAGGLRYKRRMCLSMDGIICEGKDAEESVCAGNVSCEPYIPVVCPDEPVPEISQSMPANASLPNMYRCSCEYVPWLCDNGGYCIEKMEANNRGQLFKRVSCWCNFGFYGPYCEGRFLLFIIGWFIASAVGAILGLLCCYILRTFRDKEESSQKPPYVESPPGYYLKDSASETDEWDYQETHGHPNQLMQQRQIDRELSQTFMPEQTNILSPTTQKGQDPQRHVSSPAPQNQASEEHHDSRNYASNLNQQEDYDAQAPVQSDESFPQIRLDLDDDEEDDIWKSETTSAVSEGQSFILEEVKTVIEEETICSKPKSEKKAKPEQEPELEPKPEPEPTPESKPEPEPQQQVPPKISQAQSYDVDYNICSPRRLCDIPRVSYLATKDFLSPCYSPRMMKTPSMDPCLSFECSSSFLGDMVCYSPRYDCSNMMNFDSPRFINTVPPIMCGTANCWFLPRPEIIPAHMNFNQHCPAIVCPVPPIRSCIANCGIYSSSDGNLDFVPSLARDGLSRTCDDRISKVYDSCEKPCFANRLDYTCSPFRDSCSEMAYCRQTGLSFNQLPMKRLIEERVTTGGGLGSIVTLRKCNSMEVMSGCAETTMYTEEERQVLSERAAGAGCRVSSIGNCSAGVGSNPLLHSSDKRFGGYADCSSNLFSGSSTLTRFNYFSQCTPDSVEQQEVLSEIMNSERKKMTVELPVIQRVCRIIPRNNSTCQVESNKVSSDERDFKRRGQKPSTIERRIELLSCLPKEKTSFPSPVEKRKAASAGKLPKALEETKDITIYGSFSSQPSPKATQSSLNQQEPLSDEEQAAKQIQKDDLDRAIRGFVDSIEQGAEMMSQVTRQLNSIEQGAEMMSQVTRQLNSIEQGAEMMSQVTRELNSIEQGTGMMSQVTSELNTMNSPARDVEKSPSRVEEVSNKSNWLTTLARFLGIKSKETPAMHPEGNPMVQPPMEPMALTPGRRLDRFSGVNVGPNYRGPNYMFTRGLGGGTPIRQPPRPLAERTEFNVQADLSNGSLILTPRTNYNQQVTAVNQEPRYLSSYGGPLKTQDVPASREPSPRSIEETTEINVQAELSNGSLILTPRMSYNQQATTVVNQEPRYFSSAGGPPIQQQSNSFANQQVSSVNQEPRYLSSSGGPSKKQDILVSRQPSLKYLAERREISTKHAYKGPPVDLTPTTSGSEDVIIIHEGPEFKSKSSSKKMAKKKSESKTSLSAEWKPSKRSVKQIEEDFLSRECTKNQARLGKCREVKERLKEEAKKKSEKKETQSKKSDKTTKEKEKKKKEKGPSLYSFKGDDGSTGSQSESGASSQSGSSAYTSEEERAGKACAAHTSSRKGAATQTQFQNANFGSQYFSVNANQTKGTRFQNTDYGLEDCSKPFCPPYCSPRLSMKTCGTTGTRFQNVAYSSKDGTCMMTSAPGRSTCFSATTGRTTGTQPPKADNGSKVKSDVESVTSTTSAVSSQSQSQVSENTSVIESQTSISAKSATKVQAPIPVVVITRPSRPSGYESPYEREKAKISQQPIGLFQKRRQSSPSPRDRSKRFSSAKSDSKKNISPRQKPVKSGSSRKKELSPSHTPRKTDTRKKKENSPRTPPKTEGRKLAKHDSSESRKSKTSNEKLDGRRNRSLNCLNSSAFSEFSGTAFLSGVNSDASSQPSDPQVAAIGEEELLNKSPQMSDTCSGDRDHQSISRETPIKINFGNRKSTTKSRFTSYTSDKLTPGGEVRLVFPSFARSDAPSSITLNASQHRGVIIRSFQPTWRINRSGYDRNFHDFASSSTKYPQQKF